MKVSDKPTAEILIRAKTNSEWDCCDFAVIHLSEEWRKLQATRLEAVKPFKDDYNFQSISFFDGSVEFFQSGLDDELVEEPNIEELLADRDWVYVELDDDELDKLASPENRLDFFKIVICRDGNARYVVFGKHTNEEFYTNQFSLQQLTGQAAET